MRLTLDESIREIMWNWSPGNITLEEIDTRLEKIKRLITEEEIEGK